MRRSSGKVSTSFLASVCPTKPPAPVIMTVILAELNEDRGEQLQVESRSSSGEFSSQTELLLTRRCLSSAADPERSGEEVMTKLGLCGVETLGPGGVVVRCPRLLFPTFQYLFSKSCS